MPNFQEVVIYAAGLVAVLAVLWVAAKVTKYTAIAIITRRHFDPKTFYEKYDRAMVEAMSERGGW